MLPLVKRVLTLFSPFWKPLALIALLVMTQKMGDLLVPFFAGRVIDAMAQHRTLDATYFLVAASFLFWVGHGNILPYVLGRVDVRRFRYPAPRDIGIGNLRKIAGKTHIGTLRKDTAFQQAVIERGEQVLMEFMNSLVRVAIPISLPGIVILGLLLWWYPLIGIIAIVGGLLDVLVTIQLNRVMSSRYTVLQNLDYQRQRLLTQIFRDWPAIVAEGRQQEILADYASRYGAFAASGTSTGLQFLGFNFGRGLIINLTNLLTWIVGVWYVDSGVYSLGAFLASLSWSTYVLNVVGAGIELQKQWMETTPAIRAFFAEMDAYDRMDNSGAAAAPEISVGEEEGLAAALAD